MPCFAALAVASLLALPAADHRPPSARRVPQLTLEGAHKVVEAAAALARERGVGGALAVVDAGGALLCFERLDGTFAAGSQVSIGKARTSALFRKPTRVFEEIVNEGRTSMVTIDGFTPLQGGVPLVIAGEVVGAVGVSGASSAAEDEELAMAGAAALVGAMEPLGKDETTQVIPAAEVAAAFARGSTLYSGDGLTINASRRDGPGEAEVHLADLDVFYILEGHALLVTGGSLVEGRDSATHERRGKAIEGGVERHLRAGDVVVIPAGTPHWFREVHQPLLYYVVKGG